MPNNPENNLNLKTFYEKLAKTSSVMLSHQFIMNFTGEEVASLIGNGATDLDSLTYYVKSSKVPKIEIKEVNVSFLSQKFVLPANIQFQETWDTEILVTNDLRIYDSLYNWQHLYADLARNGGAIDRQHRMIPNIDANVMLLDSDLQTVVRTFVLRGIFPTKVGALNMKYENAANPVPFTCTFCYQYVYEGKNNPLA